MPNGIIVIDKPTDWTSHDVVAKLRRHLKEKRIGHAGTLDPMATGVLPIFVGRATRAVEFAMEGEKEYIAGLRLGLTTDTQDITGRTLSEQVVSFTATDLESVLSPFRGAISQVPPMYSAIKLQGKKLYELARAGKEVERAARTITIHELEILEQVSPSDFLLRVRCSKGTYIRTLCHDIGAALGAGGCLYSLRRTYAAGFSENISHTLESVLAWENPAELLLPVDQYFASYAPLSVNTEQEKKIRNGASFPFQAADGTYRVYGADGSFLMLGLAKNHVISTIKSFFEV